MRLEAVYKVKSSFSQKKFIAAVHLASWSLSVGYFMCAQGTGLAAAAEHAFIFWGECQLTTDPKAGDQPRRTPLRLCVKGQVGSEISFVGGNPEENVRIHHGSIYTGLHVSDWLSMHGKADAQDIASLAAVGKEQKSRHRDFLVVRLGNPVLHRLRLTAGRQRLPFGIDLSTANASYRAYENRIFWSSPDYAADLTWDTQTALQVDVAYGRNMLGNGRERGSEPVKPDISNISGPLPEHKSNFLTQAVSTRIMYDVPALEGSRFVTSAYGDSIGARSFGLGFITISSKNDQTHAEYVRRMETAKGFSAPFVQLCRLSYLGAWRHGTRWAAQFDDERLRVRMGTVGMDLLFYEYFILRVGVTHIKSENGDGTRRWLLTTGLEAML